MREIILKSHGKINLGLDVLYKRPDNYHEISTIMQEIDLYDLVTIREAKDNIILESDHRDLPLDHTNLVHKAWKLLGDKTGIYKGVEIIIEKHIPIGGGLGGGSSNAATVLKGLNQLWDLKLSHEDLRQIGTQIGADVAFCIGGGTAKAEGIGEKLTSLRPFRDMDLVLINPGINISTKEVYENLKLEKAKRLDIDKLIGAMDKNDIRSLGQSMENIMEDYVISKNPIIRDIKKDLMDQGALGALMTGSGPTVFAIFNSKTRQKQAYQKLKDKYKIVLMSKTI